MTRRLQKTLARPVSAEGVGLHSGKPARMTILPAPADAGIVFRRLDLGGGEIPALGSHVRETRRGVTLANERGASVMTVEHLLAALMLAGVTNAVIELDGPEAPILDGSGAPVFALLEEAGLDPLDAPVLYATAKEPVRIEEGGRFVEFLPGEERVIEIEIEFADPAIGRQEARLSLDDPADIARIAAARTFCSLGEVEAMRAAGLGLGGSLDNAVVVDKGRVLNEGGLRDPGEFVLHKALDLIGDLSLAGAPLRGRVRARKPGHDINTRLAAEILGDRARFPLRSA